MNKMTSSAKHDLTIFVNTSDSFDDCWKPFFKLFKLYWPNCPFPIVLNTETKEFSYKGLNIRCTKVAHNKSDKLGWSECLMRALDSIDSTYILYLQEDYFLEAPVKEKILIALLNKMKAGFACTIVFSGGVGPWKPTESDSIWEVDKKAKWRLSLQAGLWEKSVLRSLLRKHETPWQLESYGSFRTRKLKQRICSVNRDIFSGKGKDIFPYSPTGIVAGRWVKSIVEPLFKKHGIYVDFSQRGFHIEGLKIKKRRPILIRALDRFRSIF